jgi:chaperonin cofactor prefoldin
MTAPNPRVSDEQARMYVADFDAGNDLFMFDVPNSVERAVSKLAADLLDARERGDRLYGDLLTAREDIERLRVLLMTCNMAADGSSETDDDPAVQVARRVGDLIAETKRLRAELESANERLRADKPNLEAYQARNRELQAEVERLRDALVRCHALLIDARCWIDLKAHPDWHLDAETELIACDEAGECPTVAPPPPDGRVVVCEGRMMDLDISDDTGEVAVLIDLLNRPDLTALDGHRVRVEIVKVKP